MTEPPAPPPGPDSSRPAGASWRRMGVLIVIASFVGIWGYVLYLSIFVGRAEPRDRLDDTSWTEAAERTCAESQGRIDALPFANEFETPDDRADALDAATAQLEVMVDRLRGLVAPADPAEAQAVAAWLDDYEDHLADRRAYADRFRAGLDEPFRSTDRGGFQLDVLIDDFARVNFMESCETPNDVG